MTFQKRSKSLHHISWIIGPSKFLLSVKVRSEGRLSSSIPRQLENPLMPDVNEFAVKFHLKIHLFLPHACSIIHHILSSVWRDIPSELHFHVNFPCLRYLVLRSQPFSPHQAPNLVPKGKLSTSTMANIHSLEFRRWRKRSSRKKSFPRRLLFSRAYTRS